MPGARNKKGLIQVKRSLFRKILLFFLILIALFIATLYVTYRYFLGVHENEIKRTYETSLANIGTSTDTLLHEIYQNTYLLSSDPELIEILYVRNYLPVEKYGSVIHVRELLNRLLNTKEIIDSITIVLKEAGMVISTNGSMELNNYFGHFHQYQEYPKEYWMDYKVPRSKFRVLKPSQVDNVQAGTGQSLVPIVIQQVGSYSTTNLFIIDLKSSYFAKMLNDHKLTENSQLYILDPDGASLEQAHPDAVPPELQETDFLEHLHAEGKQVFTHTIDGEKMLVIMYPSRNIYLDGYRYVACVPYSDLASQLSFVRTVTVTASTVSLLLALLMSYFMSRIIYSPIRALAFHIRQSRPDEGEGDVSRDEMDYIHNRVHLLLNNNESLARNLSAVVPLLQEKVLLRLLNSDEFLSEVEVQSFWKNNEIVFPYNEFVVVSADLAFTESFNLHFSPGERSQIFFGMKKIWQDIFPKDWTIYILAEKNKLHLILNPPPESRDGYIYECVQRFLDIFHFDQEFLALSVGIGGKHQDYSGLHQSYKESLKALSTVFPYSGEWIKTYRMEQTGNTYLLRMEEENRLFNYLMGGHCPEALELLHAVIDRNLCLHEEIVKELYLRLYHIGLKVAMAKALRIEQVMEGDERIAPSSSLTAMSPGELAELLSVFYERLCNALAVSTKLDVQEIIRYIDSHYTEDVYLDQLAERFGTSGKYLSRLLRNALGIPFQQYLAHLRITKAKELLRGTAKPVLEISGEAGFNNKNTFIRMFKKLEGITPSEYRAQYKKGN